MCPAVCRSGNSPGLTVRPESLLSARAHWGPGGWASRAAALCPAAWPLVDLRPPWPLQRPHPEDPERPGCPHRAWAVALPPGAHSGPAGLPRPPFLSLLRPPRRAESDAAASPRLPEPPVGAPPWSYPVSVRSSLLGKSAPPTTGRGAQGSRRLGEGVDFWPVSFIPSISVATAAAGSPHSSELPGSRGRSGAGPPKPGSDLQPRRRRRRRQRRQLDSGPPLPFQPASPPSSERQPASLGP